MPSFDRLDEFLSAVQAIRSRSPIPAVDVSIPGTKHSQFRSDIFQVSREIDEAQARLERLETTRNRTVYGSGSISQGESQKLNRDLAVVSDRFRHLHSLQKTLNHRENTSENEHLGQILATLQTRLMEISSRYQQLLHVQSKHLAATQERQTIYGIGIEEYHDSGVQNAQQQALMLEIQPTGSATETYYQSRSTAMESIENAISELGLVFQQLAHMVAIQGETVQRIDADLEEAQLHVNRGQEELFRYARGLSSNRMLMIKSFSILLAFVILFSVFFS